VEFPSSPYLRKKKPNSQKGKVTACFDIQNNNYSLGAEAAINYKTTDNLSKSILDVVGNKGVDVILDCVGPQYYATVFLNPPPI